MGAPWDLHACFVPVITQHHDVSLVEALSLIASASSKTSDEISRRFSMRDMTLCNYPATRGLLLYTLCILRDGVWVAEGFQPGAAQPETISLAWWRGLELAWSERREIDDFQLLLNFLADKASWNGRSYLGIRVRAAALVAESNTETQPGVASVLENDPPEVAVVAAPPGQAKVDEIVTRLAQDYLNTHGVKIVEQELWNRCKAQKPKPSRGQVRSAFKELPLRL